MCSCCWFVIVSQLLEEGCEDWVVLFTNQKAIVLVVSVNLLAGIDSTQVGDPLVHCQEGRLHSASSYGFADTPIVSEPYSEDQQVGDLEFLVVQFL